MTALVVDELEHEIVMDARLRIFGAVTNVISARERVEHVESVIQMLRAHGVIARRVEAELGLRRATDPITEEPPPELSPLGLSPGGASSFTEIDRPRPHDLGQDERERGQTGVIVDDDRDERR